MRVFVARWANTVSDVELFAKMVAAKLGGLQTKASILCSAWHMA